MLPKVSHFVVPFQFCLDRQEFQFVGEEEGNYYENRKAYVLKVLVTVAGLLYVGVVFVVWDEVCKK